MNKTEYNDFIKKLIDNLYDVILHADTAMDYASKLEQIRKSVIEKTTYVFAALNPKSEVNVKFPYILIAVCYALKDLNRKDFFTNAQEQSIEKLESCVTQTKKLNTPGHVEFKDIPNEVYKKALEITNTLGHCWDVATSVFNERAEEINTLYKKNQEKQRVRRHYNYNTAAIEELVVALYPNTDQTIEQKIKKFWRAIDKASKSNPKIDNWFVIEDGVKKFRRRYYVPLRVALGITKKPQHNKGYTIEELATTLYPDDATQRNSFCRRIQYLSASLSFTDFAKLFDFFTCDKNNTLLLYKEQVQDFVDFLGKIQKKPQKVIPEQTLTFEELADLIFYDEENPNNRVKKLYNRKAYVKKHLTQQRKQNPESWFIQIWGGKCFDPGEHGENYVKFFEIMRPGEKIPKEQLDLLGIENYKEPQQTLTNRQPNEFVDIPDSIDSNLPFDELAKILYPTLTSSRSYLDKRICYLLKDYPDYIPKIRSEWFIKGAKGKKWLLQEYFKDFKTFLALPLKSPRPQSPSQLKKSPKFNFGRGMSGIIALEKYNEKLQSLAFEITQKRNDAQKRANEQMENLFASKTSAKRAEFGESARKEHVIIDNCDEQIKILNSRATEASDLLQRARVAKDKWLEINAEIQAFLHPKKTK